LGAYSPSRIARRNLSKTRDEPDFRSLFFKPSPTPSLYTI
jgi:hypothetical protein